MVLMDPSVTFFLRTMTSLSNLLQNKKILKQNLVKIYACFILLVKCETEIAASNLVKERKVAPRWKTKRTAIGLLWALLATSGDLVWVSGGRHISAEEGWGKRPQSYQMMSNKRSELLINLACNRNNDYKFQIFYITRYFDFLT